MDEKMEKRLSRLKQEFENGQKMIAELETRQTNLTHTLLRISGAIQVLEELLNEDIGGEEKPETPSASEIEATATR